MATAQEMKFRIDLHEPLVTQTLLGVLQQGDAKANVLKIAVYDGGWETPAELNGNEVTGYFLREDGERVLLDGSISGHVVTVVLNENCYAINGAYGAFVRLTNTQSGVKRTILRIAGQVENEGDGPIIDPANRIPSIEDVIAQLEKMEEATEKAEQAANSVSDAVEQAQSAASTANEAAGTANAAATNANNATARANTAAETLENAPVPTGTVVTYLAGQSATTPPTGTWLANPPAVSQGQYLWTRTVQSFINGNPVTSYSVARQGMDGSGSVAAVDGVSPNSSGNVVLGAVRSVNGSKPDANGNVEVDAGGGTVQSVDGVSPDGSGNVLLGAVRSVNGNTPDASGNVEVDAGGGTVQSVNNVQPDNNGNVMLKASDVEAMPKDYTAPVLSVNQKTGEVTLNAADVGALAEQGIAADSERLGGHLPEEFAKVGESGGIAMDLLWENASPTSQFAAQTISLDGDGYQMYMIVSGASSDGAYDKVIFLRVGKGTRVEYAGTSGGQYRVGQRTLASSSKTHIEYGGMLFNAGGAESLRNDLLVPIQIYGVKGLKE